MPRACFWLALALTGALALPLAAQSRAQARPDAALLAARDSARAVRSVRSEQARFERVRRQHLPWAWGGGSGECDERIGRFCLTYSDSDDKPWRPPPEAIEVIAARDRLIAALDSAARLVPGDPWVTGQRVRYLVEAKRFGEAVGAARECRAAGGWCAALGGYALHYDGKAALADSAFSAMLAALSADERKDWTDLSRILEDRALRTYRRSQGPERERFEAKFWNLADPFWTRPGNDLRSEHFARHVADRFQDRAKSAEGLSWGEDLEEILLRFGPPVGWERIRETRPMSMAGGPPSMVTHYASTEQSLVPPPELLTPSPDLTGGQWDLEDERARATYSVMGRDSSLAWIYPLPHQLAVFRRGDSAVVVAAYDLPADSFPAGSRITAGLASTPDAALIPTAVLRPDAPLQGALQATVPVRPLLVSLELVSDEAHRAARVRRGLRIEPVDAGAPAVSDLLLLRSADALPDSLGAAIEQARGSDRVRPGEQVGVYWEVYGLGGGEGPNMVTMSVRLLDKNRGWARRMAERVGLVRQDEPIRMQWKEPTGRASYLPRALYIEIPHDLGPDLYTLELAVELIGRDPLVVRRDVRVER